MLRTIRSAVVVASKIFLYSLIALCMFLALILFIPLKNNEQPLWGVNFSSEYAKELGLDWQDAYEEMLSDLHPSAVRTAAYWDSIEREQGVFDFSELDWQMERAAEHGVQVIVAVGMKVPRWPECHIPEWAWEMESTGREYALHAYMREVVERYRTHSAFWRWQVENEPYVYFGICPQRPDDFLIDELRLVASQDDAHEIVVHIIPEAIRNNPSAFFPIPREIRVPAVNIYMRDPRYQLQLPFSTLFLRGAYQIFAVFLSGYTSIVTELQAEPWGNDSVDWQFLPEHNIRELRTHIAFDTTKQGRENETPVSFLPDDFRQIIKDARNAGFTEYYFWGAESWYAQRQRGDSDMWEIAKDVFQNSKKID